MKLEVSEIPIFDEQLKKDEPLYVFEDWAIQKRFWRTLNGNEIKTLPDEELLFLEKQYERNNSIN